MIEKYFDSIDHELLMEAVQKRITDPKGVRLIRRWLKAGVMEDGVVHEAERRTPQWVKEKTSPQRYSGTNLRDVLAGLRPILLGWAAYFRTGKASMIYAKVERYVLDRLGNLLRRRSQRAFRTLTVSEARSLGLPRLQGTIRYPGGANARTG